MILVTGANGQVGHDLIKELTKRNMPCVGIDRNDLDITDKPAVMDYISQLQPKAVIHCAAYTAVDQAEDEIDLCRSVNVDGSKYIAQACRQVGAKMLYLSTDYVFSGEGEEPYQVDSIPAPGNVYGQSKLDGELAIRDILEQYFIVRISWVFGTNGANFVKTMLRLGREKAEIKVVADQIGSPTYSVDLAKLLCDMIASDKYGIYHATNEGYCSWADFAADIIQKAGFNCRIIEINSTQYETKAYRPLNSRLSKTNLAKAGFTPLPIWQDALNRYLLEIGEMST